jgi:hypothetical protein
MSAAESEWTRFEKRIDAEGMAGLEQREGQRLGFAHDAPKR